MFMCGIWGIADRGSGLDRELLFAVAKRLMVLSETRGKDASGLAIMQEGKLVVLRKAKPAHDLLQDEDFKQYVNANILRSSSDPIYIIGHSRLVTNGSQYHPHNNQPVAKHDIALVHNGIVVNEEQLWASMLNAEKEYEVDSEVILEMLHNRLAAGDNAKAALDQSFRGIRGMASILCLVQQGHAMLAASNNGSLYQCQSKDGTLAVFASESLMLRRLAQAIPILKRYLDLSTIRQLTKAESVVLSDEYEGARDSIEITEDSEKKVVSPNLNLTNFTKYEIDFDKIHDIRRCTKCVLPETMPFIEFDEDGVCNYCRGYKKVEYKGKKELEDWNTKFHGGHKKAMVSFSGGRDSSYGLHYFVKEMGIKPIAYCYDWGMVTDIARRNQSRMCEQLGVEFILVSADITKKRGNIRKNVEAWLKSPSLGMVPLFMAGDKHYFYYANKVQKDYGINDILLAANPFETTYFKTGYCGVVPDILKKEYQKLAVERLPIRDVFKMAAYYAGQFVKNKDYINSSLIDTVTAAVSFYIIPHNYFRLFDYIPWDEQLVNHTLINEYDWECAEDTKNTWRIGDGTAPFYNYIYCMVAGFTENDTLRSNQIREGMISREEALYLVYQDNQPRFEAMKWYFDAIHVSMADALDIVGNIPKLYAKDVV